jgi:hypothetical protein
MCRAEAMEAALRGESGEIRQLALRHPAFGELGIHAVEAEDDDLLLEPLGGRTAAARNRECGECQGDKASTHVDEL